MVPLLACQDGLQAVLSLLEALQLQSNRTQARQMVLWNY
jgi:hypothetical protein